MLTDLLRVFAAEYELKSDGISNEERYVMSVERALKQALLEAQMGALSALSGEAQYDEQHPD